MAKADIEILWTELEPGCVVTEPGSSKAYRTGDWRSFRPVLNKDRCIQCGLCWIFCPDMAYAQDGEGYYESNPEYCKGCGVCAKECPTNAIGMVEEEEPEL